MKPSQGLRKKCQLVARSLQTGLLHYDPVTGRSLPIHLDSIAKTNGTNAEVEDLKDCPNNFIRSYERSDWHSKQKRRVASIKGILEAGHTVQNITHNFSAESTVYRCRYFTLQYYPESHFLSILRKSSPSVNVKDMAYVPLNNYELGNLVTGKLAAVFHNRPTLVPRKYASLRRYIKLSVKNAFAQEWYRLKDSNLYNDVEDTNVKDGLYQYLVTIFPNESTKEDFEDCVKKSIHTVCQLDMQKFLKTSSRDKTTNGTTWVDKANSKVDLNLLNRYLQSSRVPYKVERFTNAHTKG